MFHWPVVPICERQRRDVRPEDLIDGGLYRMYDLDLSMEGVDKLRSIARRRLGVDYGNKVFVVQLRGCRLKCVYCYVTEGGIWGEPELISTDFLVSDFKKTGARIFHLMGGAPDIYLHYWKELAEVLPQDVLFHSDFSLVDEYNVEDLRGLPGLYAASIKREQDVGVPYSINRIVENLVKLRDCGVNFYVTFTGMDEYERDRTIRFLSGDYDLKIFADGFNIPVRRYKALDG